ncbi:MAG TPA: FtsX-like permease family protein, partial [Opitutus sp.]|nr:FtsX-like permease family protein [Opitutus sp.]
GRGPQQPPPMVVFVPYTLRGATQRAIMVRTEVEPTTLLNAVRSELRALDKEQPMQRPLTVEDLDERQLAQPRFNLSLLGALAVIALVLAAAGIYSVLSYAVAQRTKEIGLRMALGADRANVLRLFLRLGVRLLATGVAIGLAGSIALTRVVSSQLFNGPAFDPLAFVLAVVLLSAAALLACYWPARRATRVDPMVALRAD